MLAHGIETPPPSNSSLLSPQPFRHLAIDISLSLFNPHPRIIYIKLVLERNIDVREKYGPVASHMCPDLESNWQPLGVPGQRSNPLSHRARAPHFFLS